MKTILSLVLIATISLTTFSQELNKKEQSEDYQTKTYLYAYISVEGRIFSNKFDVIVDLGDSSQLVTAAKELSKVLNGKKSLAAILNEMSQRGYELVDSQKYMATFDDPGEMSGVIFIMKTEIHYRRE